MLLIQNFVTRIIMPSGTVDAIGSRWGIPGMEVKKPILRSADTFIWRLGKSPIIVEYRFPKRPGVSFRVAPQGLG